MLLFGYGVVSCVWVAVCCCVFACVFDVVRCCYCRLWSLIAVDCCCLFVIDCDVLSVDCGWLFGAGCCLVLQCVVIVAWIAVLLFGDVAVC